MRSSLPDNTGETVEVAFPKTGDVDPEHPNLVFTFHTIVLPGARYEELLRKHPGDEGMKWGDSFPPALIAASVVGWTVADGPAVVEDEARHPKMSEAEELWDDWPQWARAKLFTTIRDQNLFGVSLGKAR